MIAGKTRAYKNIAESKIRKIQSINPYGQNQKGNKITDVYTFDHFFSSAFSELVTFMK